MSMTISNRILIVDDTNEIHEDFRKILKNPKLSPKEDRLKKLELELFGDDSHPNSRDLANIEYEIDSAYHSNQAIQMVNAAQAEERPYAVIFMDVRMPPGLNGVETMEKIWKDHPHIEMVLVTAYSDYSWEQIMERVGATDRLMFLRKPFDHASVKQMALALTRKHNLTSMVRRFITQVEHDVQSRNHQLINMIEEIKRLD